MFFPPFLIFFLFVFVFLLFLVFSFMKDNVNVDGFKKLLVAPEINEASLPAAIYRGKLKPPLAVV